MEGPEVESLPKEADVFMNISIEAKVMEDRNGNAAGIVIHDRVEPVKRPVIAAFIWGGKVRPMPTLPFGRWKATAA